MPSVPHRLRVDHLDEPLGIRTLPPRLSWQLPDGAERQLAWRVRTDDGWDSGRVDDDRSLLVPWPGPALSSSQRVIWQVEVWTDRGESGWSAPAWFETGLLREEDWRVSWIRPREDAPAPPPGHRPAYLLRGHLDVAEPVARARLHITAHGLYEAFLNGSRVGDHELTPGYTQYEHRLQVQTFDVTRLVREGGNVLGVVLADGWFRGQTGALRDGDQWGAELALLAQLDVTSEDGTLRSWGTGPRWRGRIAHVVAADLIAGERQDLRLVVPGWSEPAGEHTEGEAGWREVLPADLGFDHLVGSPAPPVRRVEELVPVAAGRVGPDRQVFDLGQNINGWARLRRLGPAGTRLVLTHGEHLDASGDVSTDHLRPDFPFLPAPLPAGQVDEVVSAGRPGEVFEPRRTTHGFRYVRVEGHPEDLGPDDLRGVVVHTDMRRTGWFACSDERLNRLHEAVVWSLRDNTCDIPTDCPQRERAGWTGDWQIFARPGAFLYDVAGLSTKWLRDLLAAQAEDGTVLNMAPCPPAEGLGGPTGALNGSAGWGDAVVVVPWEVYRAYGDERILAEAWPGIVGWLGRAERMAREGRHPERAAGRPVPAPHERYLWDTGFHWGEWLAPGEEPKDFGAFVAADKSDVATAYLASSAGLAARIGEVLGHDDAAARYRRLAERAREAWRAEFTTDDGLLIGDTQANHARALAFGLVPDAWRERVAHRLAQLVRANGTRLATGFLATPDLLPVLADTGHLDLAYALLLQDADPSWLAMIDRGATTMWEHWDGVDANGIARGSLNHYSKGAVVSFLHRYVAGLEPLAPAYRRFRVRPRLGGGLTAAEAVHESPYGRIETSWRLDGERLHVRVIVPAGTEAEVVLPDGATRHTGTGALAVDVRLPREDAWTEGS